METKSGREVVNLALQSSGSLLGVFLLLFCGHYVSMRLCVSMPVFALVCIPFLVLADTIIICSVWAVYRGADIRLDGEGIHRLSFLGRWQTLEWDSIAEVIDGSGDYRPKVPEQIFLIEFRTASGERWNISPKYVGDLEAFYAVVLENLPPDIPIKPRSSGTPSPLEEKRRNGQKHTEEDSSAPAG